MVRRSRQVRRIEALPRPVLLLQGERDQICPAPAATAFAQRTGADQFKYANARHHLLLEECRERVAEDAAGWIAKRLQRS
jgi:alpha-beta hydrolase superfamily lysophospholipase